MTKDGETVVRVERAAKLQSTATRWNITPPNAASCEPASRRRAKTTQRVQHPDKLITKDGITIDDNAWRIEAKEDRVVRLFEIADPGVENCTVHLSGQD